MLIDFGGYILIAFLAGWFFSRLYTTLRLNKTISFWMNQWKMANQMYLDEKEFFKQAMELATKYRENSKQLKAAFIDYLEPEDRKEVERLMQITELEQMFSKDA